MIEISEGLGTVMAAVVTVLATLLLALKKGNNLPPKSPIPVSPSAEFDTAIKRLENAVREVGNATMDARQTIGSLGGQIGLLHEATKQIQPLGERTAVLENALEKIDHRVEDVFDKMREVNHTLRNIQQRNMAVDERDERARAGSIERRAARGQRSTDQKPPSSASETSSDDEDRQ